MPLNLVTTGNTILASDVDQLVNVLQRSSGQNELGAYYLSSFATAASQTISQWINSLSRGVLPTGATIDQSIVTTNGNAPGADTMDIYGFRVDMTANGASNNLRVGGHYTLSF